MKQLTIEAKILTLLKAKYENFKEMKENDTLSNILELIKMNDAITEKINKDLELLNDKCVGNKLDYIAANKIETYKHYMSVYVNLIDKQYNKVLANLKEALRQ